MHSKPWKLKTDDLLPCCLEYKHVKEYTSALAASKTSQLFQTILFLQRVWSGGSKTESTFSLDFKIMTNSFNYFLKFETINLSQSITILVSNSFFFYHFIFSKFLSIPYLETSGKKPPHSFFPTRHLDFSDLFHLYFFLFSAHKWQTKLWKLSLWLIWWFMTIFFLKCILIGI